MSSFTPPVPTGALPADPLVPTAVLGPVHHVLADAMATLHDALGVPWGWTIVLLVLAIRLLLLPATVASYRAGHRMRAHAERTKALSERHGGDARRVAADPEYAGAGCGILGGVLGPLLVQGLALFALYGTLRDELAPEICRAAGGACADALTGGAAAFGPVVDLTQPAAGGLLVGLLAVAGAAQALAVLAAPRPDDRPRPPLWTAVVPAVLLVPFGAVMPAGVLVYWIASALIGLVLMRLVARWDARRPGRRRAVGRVAAPG